MRKTKQKHLSRIYQFLKQNSAFISSLSVVLLISLFALSFYSENYIDLIFIFGFTIFTTLSLSLSLYSYQFAWLGLICIISAGFMLLIGYDKYALAFAQWAYLFLAFTIGYNVIYYFSHKKELVK